MDILTHLGHQAGQLNANTKRLLVGFSGGLDSRLLVETLAQLRNQFSWDLEAVHVHHNLSNHADAWVSHCQSICEALDIPLHVKYVNAKADVGESPEAKAREMRHAAFTSLLGPDDILALAQHQDDQAETLLLQLLRGAGVEGLAAMPRLTNFGLGNVWRPLLDITRDAIKAYAQAQQWQWIEDPSNEQCHYDRNYLRHRVLPILKQRWPSASKTIARSAQFCAEAATLVDRRIDALYASINNCAESTQDQLTTQLGCTALLRLDLVERKAILRHWITQAGFPVPSAAQLQQIIDEVIPARLDANPRVFWRGVEVRRYRDTLYLRHVPQPFDLHTSHQWNLTGSISLPEIAAQLSATDQIGEGIRMLDTASVVTIAYRQGGEHFRDQDNVSKSLKPIWQQLGIPPWERNRVPLLMLEHEVIAIADGWIAPYWRTNSNEQGKLIKLLKNTAITMS